MPIEHKFNLLPSIASSNPFLCIPVLTFLYKGAIIFYQEGEPSVCGCGLSNLSLPSPLIMAKEMCPLLACARKWLHFRSLRKKLAPHRPPQETLALPQTDAPLVKDDSSLSVPLFKMHNL